ncbi:MAG: hypothetical protein EPN37_04870 [Chitinophagaceae bacterium]|nr:MAG: hypothetical protein EPN37_04870 [Chitinophagaceae bacterium]
MYAQHLAEEYVSEPEIHPLLYVEAQQTLARSTIFKNRRNKWLGILPAAEGGYYIIPIKIFPKFVVIQTCYIGNHADMSITKKQKGISGKKKRPAKKADRIVDVRFSEPFVKAIEREGFVTIEDVKDVLLQFVNRSEASRRKYSKLANS